MSGGAASVLEHDIACGNPELKIEVPALLDGFRVDNIVGPAGEEINFCARQIRRRIDPAIGGEFFDDLPVGGDIVQHDRGSHAGPESQGRERLHAVLGHRLDRASIEAARDHRRAHHPGRMGDVNLVRHEGAGREAGDGNLRRVDGEVLQRLCGVCRRAGKHQQKRRNSRQTGHDECSGQISAAPPYSAYARTARGAAPKRSRPSAVASAPQDARQALTADALRPHGVRDGPQRLSLWPRSQPGRGRAAHTQSARAA